MNKNTKDHLSEHEISKVVDTMLSSEYENLDAKIKTHLELCIDCKMQTVELFEMLNAMDEANISEKPQVISLAPSISKSGTWKLWSLVASIALLIAFSLFYWQDRKGYETKIANLEEDLTQLSEQVVIKKYDSLNAIITEMEFNFQHQIEVYADSVNQAKIKQEENQSLFVSLYEINALLEEEMNLELRSNDLKLSSPVQTHYNANEKIIFKWNNKQVTQIDLVLYNNKGLSVFTAVQIKNNYELPIQKLSLGTYYWQIFNENEMVAMDRFELH